MAKPTEKCACTKPQYCHDLAHVLAQAEQICTHHSARLTKTRKQVLSLICQAQAPIGAYALLEQLQQYQASAKPPTVYRALDFLLEHKLIHRIDSLNSYLICPHPDQQSQHYFFTCSCCKTTFELNDRNSQASIDNAIAAALKQNHCTLEHVALEITGRCQHCS